MVIYLHIVSDGDIPGSEISTRKYSMIKTRICVRITHPDSVTIDIDHIRCEIHCKYTKKIYTNNY